MADSIPQVILGIDEGSHSVVILGGETRIGSLSALVAAAPGLLHPDAAGAMARAVAHFAAGSDFRVIEDPAAYAAAYRAQVEGEDPDAPWQQGVLRLRDHGMPDFDAITAPAYHGTTLVFHASAAPLPLPYRVEIDVSDPTALVGPDMFRALDLEPFPPAAVAPAANPFFVGELGVPVRRRPDDEDDTPAVPRESISE